MNEMTVRVDHSIGGSWAIALSDQREALVCKTLEEASSVAYRCAADRRPCELVVCDAYHRVVRHELINTGGGPGSLPAARPGRLS